MVVSDLTSGTLEGVGTFDVLMQSVSAHLKNEFTQKRITGSDYSKAYLGGLQTVLAQSVQFVLQAPITTSQVALTDAQKLLVDEQIKEQTKKLEVDGLLDQQVSQVIASIAQANTQSLLIDQQIAVQAKALEVGGLLDQQVLTAIASLQQTDAQTALVNAQKGKVDTENLLTIQQLNEQIKKLVLGGLLDKQVAQLDAAIAQTNSQKSLIDEQVNEQTKKLELGGLADQQVLQVLTSINQEDTQTTLVAAQKLLIDQQIAAQVKDLEANGLADQKVLQTIASINQADAQTTLTGTQNTKIASDNALVVAQTTKVDNEALISVQQKLLIAEQINTQLAKTTLTTNQSNKELSSIGLVDEQTASATYNRTSILPEQKAKLLNETKLALAKVESENAQTSDTMKDGITPVAGTIGKQQNLLTEQKESYKRNNEYKVAKMMMDNHSIHTNAGGTVDRGLANTDDGSIGNVLTQLKTNVSLPTG